MEFLQITLTGWVALSIALSMSLLAGLMFILGEKRFHYIWGIFCVAIAVWAWGFYMVSLSMNAEAAQFWWKITYIGIILNPFLYFQFALEFVENPFFLKNRLHLTLIINAVAAAFLFLDLATNLMVNQVTILFGQLYYNTPPGAEYVYFMILFPTLICISLFLIAREYRKRKDDQEFRQRAIYFFLASAIAYIGGGLNFLPVYGIEVNPTTNFAVAFGAIFIAYAILRRGLFEVRVVTAQFLTLILAIFMLVRLFVSGSMQEAIFNLVMLAVTLGVGAYLILSVRREMEQRELIEKQERELEIANTQQESLLHFISHEIKGYLTKGQNAFAGIVEGDFGEAPEGIRTLATGALGEMRKGVETVMGILDASNFKKGTVTFDKKEFDFKAAVLAVVDELKPTAQEKNITIREVFAPTGASHIIGDAQKIRQHVIRNLIDNSIKYTPTGGTIDVLLSQTGSVVRLETKDSGVGITPEDMKQLFTEGGHGKDSIKVNVHSTGYGLFIAKQVVEAHGGKIWAESDGQGKGSRFVVELPIA